MPCMDRHLPTEIRHEFVPAQTDPNICIALIETATYAEHGFSHHAQCGHTRDEHEECA